MSNILIAGGSGYIGTLLVDKLSETSHNFTVLDLMWFGNNFKFFLIPTSYAHQYFFLIC